MQATLFALDTPQALAEPTHPDLLPLEEYDRIVVAYSGGKDSTACILHMLELGVPKEKVELWHHDIDGCGDTFMDWPVTHDYCRAIAEELGITLRYSWKVGGFYREMMREDTPTAPTEFEASDDTVRSVGGKGKPGTRRLFPQVSASLSVRWCSAYLKVDVGRIVFANDPAYQTGKYLFITGERREESAARAKYAEVERHPRTNRSRRVDQWRPIIDWTEAEVWEIIERHRIQPHPAYRLGWGRLSCRTCIFGDANQWASVRAIAPTTFDWIAELEDQFGKTIHRTKSVAQQADSGTVYPETADAELVTQANSRTYTGETRVADWQLPAGAFKGDAGPC